MRPRYRRLGEGGGGVDKPHRQDSILSTSRRCCVVCVEKSSWRESGNCGDGDEAVLADVGVAG